MPNFYSIFFTRDGEVARLPVNPEKLPDSQDTDNGSYNVLGLGPITIPRIPKQRVVTISGLLPGLTSLPSVTSLLTYKPPEYFIKFFRSAMADRVPILYTPARFYETGIPFAISQTGYYVLVTKFDFEERGAETGDFYFDLECVEWRDPAPAKVQVQGGSPAATSGQAAAAASMARSATPETTITAAQAVAAAAVSAIVGPTRSVSPNQLVVGTQASLSGNYYQDSAESLAGTPASGLPVTVARIITAPFGAPVYVRDSAGNGLGWCEKESLTVVSQNAN